MDEFDENQVQPEVDDEEVVVQTNLEKKIYEAIPEDKPEKEKKLYGVPKGAIILAVVFAILLSLFSSVVTAMIVLKDAKEKQKVVVYEEVNMDKVLASEKNDLTDVIAEISNSVVEVYTEYTTYSNFFGSKITEGAGSGVVYSKNGYIITNNHVIEDATNIKVILHDGTEFDAELVGADPESDLAVLKIAAENLHPAILGDSDALKVGQNCIAIGNPLGTLGGTVTNGIISALSREVKVEGQEMTLLQTNTAINPGNSGGGLFTQSGELIGIVNAKSNGDSVEGIGFAIPINNAKGVVEDLIEYGYVIGRAAIGIKSVSIDTVQKAWSYNVNSLGVYIAEVVGEKAQAAGLLQGDLIIGIGGEKVESYTDLKAILQKHVAGETLDFIILRENKQITIPVELSQRTN